MTEEALAGLLGETVAKEKERTKGLVKEWQEKLAKKDSELDRVRKLLLDEVTNLRNMVDYNSPAVPEDQPEAVQGGGPVPLRGFQTE